MKAEMKRQQEEFDSKRTPEDPLGKQLIVPKQLDHVDEQLALMYMVDDLSERLEEAEELIERLLEHNKSSGPMLEVPHVGPRVIPCTCDPTQNNQ